MNKAEHEKNIFYRHSSLGTNNLSNTPRKKGSFKYESAVIVLIVILGIWYSYYRVSKTLEFSPERLYEKTFVEPLESIKDLKGGSKAIVGFDSWIRFNCPAGVTLRNAKNFSPSIGEAGRSWFADRCPNDQVLHQSADNYQYFIRTENAMHSIVNEALLVNKKTHDYFYRTWGI